MSERRAFRFDCDGCGAHLVVHDARDLRIHEARTIAEREYGWWGSSFCRLCGLLARAGWDPRTASHISVHRLPRPLRSPATADLEVADLEVDDKEGNAYVPTDETIGWPSVRLEIDGSIVRSTAAPGPLAPGRHGAAPAARGGELAAVAVGAKPLAGADWSR
ncbi:MAG: hypothetical protein HS109_20285 [Burkholderiales bacterium]|nr:hypothetical protein [Burkholderiales bacterium]